MTKIIKQKSIKELAKVFDQDLQATLPVIPLPNGGARYKDYVIKQTVDGNWGIYNVHNKDLIAQFFLKTCALLAAKAYYNLQLEKFHEIKRLDNRYWANYCDTLIYKRNIKQTKEFERYLILLNKLEYSTDQTTHLKEQITTMFKWSFV